MTEYCMCGKDTVNCISFKRSRSVWYCANADRNFTKDPMAQPRKDIMPKSAKEISDTYVDQTGTDEKPNAMMDVFLHFPLAMDEIAKATKFGADKHAPFGWRDMHDSFEDAERYHLGKLGRHVKKLKTEGFVNEEDQGLTHPGCLAWNALAYLEHYLREEQKKAKTDAAYDAASWPIAKGDTRERRTGPRDRRTEADRRRVFDPAAGCKIGRRLDARRQNNGRREYD